MEDYKTGGYNVQLMQKIGGYNMQLQEELWGPEDCDEGSGDDRSGDGALFAVCSGRLWGTELCLLFTQGLAVQDFRYRAE